MRRLSLLVASALAVTSMAACSSKTEVSEPTSAATSTTAAARETSSASDTSSSSDSSSSSDTSSSSDSSSSDTATSSSSAATSAGADSAAGFTEAVSPDKEEILKVTRDFAAAIAANDMNKACSLMTNSSVTKPLKDSPTELAGCLAGFKQTIGKDDAEGKRARSGYAIMKFEKAKQNGDRAQTSIKAGSVEMTQRIGNAKVDGKWYIDGQKPFIQ